mmetsp:Transcript_25063/g.64730  ORF Transcript_25063/g.64730 Transcript_25063/m.64730 type:complete len:300 (+) Transcript_25063:51-950(+)
MAATTAASVGRAGGTALVILLTLGAPARGAASAKATLIRLAAVTNRGQSATPTETAEAQRCLTDLQSLGSAAARDLSLVPGVWELAFAEVEPFRASPFFMALGQALDRFRLGAADRNLAAHRLATSVGTIGRTRWFLTEDELASEVELRVGVLPGVPAELRGTVRTIADLSPSDAAADGEGVSVLSVRSTRILGSELSAALPDIANGGQTGTLSLADPLMRVIEQMEVPSGLLLGGERVKLKTLFVDSELLLVSVLPADTADRLAETESLAAAAPGQQRFLFLRAAGDQGGVEQDHPGV